MADDDSPRTWHGQGQRCTAKAKSTGERCARPANRGQKVCRVHGGNAPGALAKARERIAEQQAVDRIHAALAKLDIEPVDDPLTALKNLAGEVLSWKNALGNIVNNLSDIRTVSDFGDDARAEVRLFERAMDRCINVLGVIAKLGIDDRLVAIEEAKVRMIVEAVEQALADLPLGLEERHNAMRTVAAKLRRVG